MIADRLSELLAAEAVPDIPVQLDALEAAFARVRGTDATRTLLNRLLGREEELGRRSPTVRRLSSFELPGLPSAYRDETGFEDLMAMAAREEELAPRLRDAHAERLGQAADHLVCVVRQAADAGFRRGNIRRRVDPRGPPGVRALAPLSRRAQTGPRLRRPMRHPGLPFQQVLNRVPGGYRVRYHSDTTVCPDDTPPEWKGSSCTSHLSAHTTPPSWAATSCSVVSGKAGWGRCTWESPRAASPPQSR